MQKPCFLTALLLAITCHTFAQTNLDLEAWTGVEPDDWQFTSNGLMIIGAPQSVFQETGNPGEGLSSALLETVFCPPCIPFIGSDTLPGIIQQVVPYINTPDSFSFLFKTAPGQAMNMPFILNWYTGMACKPCRTVLDFTPAQPQ